ncbi:hypothetical protein C1752_02914 [Acaryochloris thomasi RCC1774]|uniref:Uncharacterized protein n=1 Tax=Acaryochloris thomasi RCC1774 TaxID=1764569 RepID=A0A2W1JY08_9CYAN|nr:hypothetical protein [Acaryochloris thomasi]PZD73137.1 hypothetical protein C1752_02914 [Acaryochloris thomasi RCC1774]
MISFTLSNWLNHIESAVIKIALGLMILASILALTTWINALGTLG